MASQPVPAERSARMRRWSPRSTRPVMKPASSGRSKRSRCSVWTCASIDRAVSTAEGLSAAACPWLAPRTLGRTIAGGSPGSPSVSRIVIPAIWITARNITTSISSSMTGVWQERGQTATRVPQSDRELAAADPSGFFPLPGSCAKMSQEREDQGVDTPGQEPRQGQCNLCHWGGKPVLRKHFREGGRLILSADGAASFAGQDLLFFGGGQYNRRFAQSGQEASLTHPLNACGLRGVLDSGRWDCPDREVLVLARSVGGCMRLSKTAATSTGSAKGTMLGRPAGRESR